MNDDQMQFGSVSCFGKLVDITKINYNVDFLLLCSNVCGLIQLLIEGL